MPYIVIFFVTLFCLVTVFVIGGLFGFHEQTYHNTTESSITKRDLTEDDDDDASEESSEESPYVDT